MISSEIPTRMRMRLRSAGSSSPNNDNLRVLGIHLTQVGSIPCGWAASESLRRSPGSAPLGPWGASAVSGGEIDAKRALCSCVALASQWRLLIARPKRPLFSPVSGAHHHMLGLPESDGYPVFIIVIGVAAQGF